MSPQGICDQKTRQYEAVLSSLKHEFYSKSLQCQIGEVVGAVRSEDPSYKAVLIWSDDRLLEIRYRPPGYKRYCALHLGYPKPVLTMELQADWDDFGVSYTLTGSSWRHVTNEHLAHCGIDVQTVGVSQYSDMLRNLFGSEYDLLVYVDPFSDVGDSYISLCLWNRLRTAAQAQEIVVFTQNESLRGTPPFGSCRCLDSLLEAQASKLIVYPVVFDNHWEQAEAVFLRAGFHTSCCFWLPGTNLIARDGRAYRLQDEDLFLGRNLEDFLLRFAEPLGVEHINRPNRIADDSPVLLNLFAATAIKYLPLSLGNALVRRATRPVRLLLHHLDVPENEVLRECFQREEMVDLCQATTLSQLSNMVRASGAVITTDSGVAHIANHFNLPCIVYYNLDRVDRNSSISVIYHSVIGYGSRKSNFLPIVVSSSASQQGDQGTGLTADALAWLAHFYLACLSTEQWTPPAIDRARLYLGSCQVRRDNHCAERAFMSALGLTEQQQATLLHSYYTAFSPGERNALEDSIPGFGALFRQLGPLYKLALHMLEQSERPSG